MKEQIVVSDGIQICLHTLYAKEADKITKKIMQTNFIIFTKHFQDYKLKLLSDLNKIQTSLHFNYVNFVNHCLDLLKLPTINFMTRGFDDLALTYWRF